MEIKISNSEIFFIKNKKTKAYEPVETIFNEFLKKSFNEFF